MGKLFSFLTSFLDRIFLRNAFLTLEEMDGKVRLILENTRGEELRMVTVMVILPEGLSVKQIQEKSEGEVKVENGSIAWSLKALGKQDRQVLEFNMSDSSVRAGRAIEFISEPSIDESYYFNQYGLHWKIYSPQTHKVRTLLYRINGDESYLSEFTWKIQV